MQPRINLITLGVSDLVASTTFYRDVLNLPQIPMPPEVSFFEMGRTLLALYLRESLAADADVECDAKPRFPGFSLAHNVASSRQVDDLLVEVQAAGGHIIKSGTSAEWGGYSGYFADPDGFLWEVAWNPQFPWV